MTDFKKHYYKAIKKLANYLNKLYDDNIYRNTLVNVKKCTQLIRDKYPDMHTDFTYDKDNDMFNVWYDDETKDKDTDFCLFIGELIYDTLLGKHYNVVFSYDYFEHMKLLKK